MPSKPLRGWILYRDKLKDLEEIPYEIQKFIDAAPNLNFNLEVYQPEEFDLVITRDDHKGILLHGKPVELPDFVLTRLGATISYFSQAVIRQIERLGVRVINGSAGIDVSKDKLYTQQILASSGLPVPRAMVLKHPFNAALIEEKLRFPVVMKTISGSKGSGVFLANNRGEFEDLVDFLASTKGNANIVLQEFIKKSHGRDLRVFVVGGRVLACMQRFSESGSFKANVSRGGNVKQHEVTPEIEWLATETARILGLDIAGIDLLFDGETFRVCEANASPGFKGIERCFPELHTAEEVLRYVRLRVGFYPKKKRLFVDDPNVSIDNLTAAAPPAQEASTDPPS